MVWILLFLKVFTWLDLALIWCGKHCLCPFCRLNPHREESLRNSGPYRSCCVSALRHAAVAFANVAGSATVTRTGGNPACSFVSSKLAAEALQRMLLANPTHHALSLFQILHQSCVRALMHACASAYAHLCWVPNSASTGGCAAIGGRCTTTLNDPVVLTRIAGQFKSQTSMKPAFVLVLCICRLLK